MTMIETRPIETTHASFGVSNAAETFWILIDQIYSDNMSFVRESTSNARDAHVMAGTPDRPIVVHLPTLAEPWFSVRDYGPSMDHRMVTEVYTSIGKSTKTLDDSQVGAYGLGSKAAFAYTHAFKVITIIDRVKRTYQAGVEEETRIPTLDLVSTEVCEEENGVEVIVPIEARDIDACVRAGKALGRGFHPTLPICNYDITPETPIYEGVDWRLYPAEGNFGVRMGCVIYPIPRATALNMVGNCNLNWQYSMTIDVPIGSVHTTAAREALKFSDKTNETLAATFPRAIEDLRIQLLDQVRNADGMREAMRLRDQNNQIWKQDYEYQGRPIPVNFRFADIPVYKVAKRGS